MSFQVLEQGLGHHAPQKPQQATSARGKQELDAAGREPQISLQEPEQGLGHHAPQKPQQATSARGKQELDAVGRETKISVQGPEPGVWHKVPQDPQPPPRAPGKQDLEVTAKESHISLQGRMLGLGHQEPQHPQQAARAPSEHELEASEKQAIKPMEELEFGLSKPVIARLGAQQQAAVQRRDNNLLLPDILAPQMPVSASPPSPQYSTVWVQVQPDSVCSICNAKLHEPFCAGNRELTQLSTCAHMFHTVCLARSATTKCIPQQMACPYMCHTNYIALKAIQSNDIQVAAASSALQGVIDNSR